MLLCPKCKLEYQEGYKTCSECGSDLIEQVEVKKNINNQNNHFKAGPISLNSKLNLLFGIIGAMFLVLLRLPQVDLYSSLGIFKGYVTDYITTIISMIGVIFIVFFSSLLIVDTVKSIYKH